MLDEAILRTREFDEGPHVRLGDGQTWFLPARLVDVEDPAYGALLEEVAEAEDEAGRLRAELALTIVLLGRNYRLSAQDYQQLLTFPAGDERLGSLQRVVHELTLEALERQAASVSQSTHPHPAYEMGLLGQIGQALWLRLVGRIP